MTDEMTRSELEARVYSRAGADDPRVQRIDPLTGKTVKVSDSEWQLLLSQPSERRSPPTPSTETDSDPRGTPPTDASPSTRLRPGRRPRITPAAAALSGFAVASALIGGWLWISESTRTAPSLALTIVPTPAPDASAGVLPEAAVFDVFRDPAVAAGVLPWWLMRDFPIQQAAELVPPDDAIPGASIYAAISDNTVTCLVVRLDPNGLSWNCTSTEHVLSSGLTMHVAIPADLGAPRDGDDDGISGEWTETDLLTIEWRTDGTFVVTRAGD
ncbi:hypothetical protein BCL57_002622 [Agromyces flavus]|uniref:Uncharacterized protein n=1 Tax=Agromyces flavus TaxID=589382 RepID=A0A1H1TCY6_9MICO|nr:hypothetical protein [Agromyces flavus]MCP2368449.1 hypothetical protein [Agromyces flavus]GGI47909.1 hypothetical protein GCM10010932_25970 [Agromyces flavus]SDS58028.1 hypothetical protein SAMN04489721_1552 [Agromyces flavus]